MTIGVVCGPVRNYQLPKQEPERFPPVGRCIYCGAAGVELSDEHIIAFAIGGRWILDQASCEPCAKVTSSFEGRLSRTILGPLRMLYEMPTRRPQDRPEHLELKAKFPGSTDWEIAHVARDICPFLVLAPIYPLPDLLTGVGGEERGIGTKTFAVRGGGFWADMDAHMEWICKMLGASEIMPEGRIETEAWCLTVSKVAHVFAVAHLGLDGFEHFLGKRIVERDMADRADFLGGGRGDEESSKTVLHDVAFDPSPVHPELVVVRVRLFAILGLPTYTVVVGRNLRAASA